MMDALASDEPTLLSRSVHFPTGQTIDDYTPQDGDHLCSLWTDPLRDRGGAEEFLGSPPDGAALWIQEPSRGDATRRSLSAKDLTNTGTAAVEMRVYSTRDVYLPDGTFNPERLYRFWKERVEEMSGPGRRRVRIVAEMDWMREDRAWTESAPGYESGLNRILAASPAAVICQYGSTRFRPHTVLAMLLSHPRVVIGRRVFANPFHVADEVFPAVHKRLSADPIAALIPMWRHYLHRLPNASEVGAFLVNSLASFITADTVTLQITGQPRGWCLETGDDVLREIEPDESGSRAASHLFAFWPSGGNGLGGGVHAGTYDGVSCVEASFDGHPRCVVLSRRKRFERGELMAFTTLASGISLVLTGVSRFA